MSLHQDNDGESRYSVIISNTPLDTLERFVSKQDVSKRFKVITLEWLGEDVGDHLHSRAVCDVHFTRVEILLNEEVANLNMSSAIAI